MSRISARESNPPSPSLRLPDSVVVGGPQPRSDHGLAIQANAMAVSRLPARPMASVQKSERTTPCEGFVSGGLVTEQSGIQPKSTMAKIMKAWNEIKHYAGFDWAKDHHDVIVLDAGGKTVADFRFDHTAGGWEEFSKKLASFPERGDCRRDQTRRGHRTADGAGMLCVPVHTRSAKGYRQRKVPSGNKTDRVDAWSLADALRLDGAHWKQLSAQDPLIKELRLLCRDEVALIRDRTALITQLRQAVV
jgi:hypothetical protein